LSQKHATAALLYDGVVGYEADDSDLIVWRNNGVAMDAKDGARSWLRSPEAQRFLPPSGTRGSGGTRGAGTPSGQALTPEEVSRNVWRALGENIE